MRADYETLFIGLPSYMLTISLYLPLFYKKVEEDTLIYTSILRLDTRHSRWISLIMSKYGLRPHASQALIGLVYWQQMYAIY